VVALLLLLLSGYTSAQSPRRRSGTGHGPAAGSPGALQAALVLPQVPLSAAPTHGAQLLPRTVSALRALLDEDGSHREALRVLGELYQVCLEAPFFVTPSRLTFPSSTVGRGRGASE